MSRNRFRWSGGSDSQGAAVVSVVSELERVREAASGRPKARDVVAAARSSMSPLHRFFLWDDTEAAERYRERQARELLQSIVVMREERDTVREQSYSIEFFGEGGGAPAKTADPGLVAGVGERVRSVFLGRDADQVDAREERAWEELLAWQAKYGRLAHFAEVTAAIARARARAAA